MAFTHRVIKLKFKLGSGVFNSGSDDTVEIEGLRCSANIVHQGIGYAEADVQVWGMPLELMNKLTVLNKVRFEQQVNNQLIIEAGDENGTAMCFGGAVWEAWADGRQAPDVVFHVSANSGLFVLSQSIPPTSYKGSVDAAFVISGIAQQMGYAFENSGVTGRLTDPYKPGSPKSQIESVCNDVNCAWTVDDANKVVAIWPKDGARDGDVLTISKDTGLVGYPSFTQAGIQFTTLFNPSLEFGRKIKMESQFQTANGQWQVYGLAHRLESNLPGGEWFTDVECMYLDHTT